MRVTAEGQPASEAVLELPGGEAFNTATALVGWGANVFLTGTAIGADVESDRLRSLLDDPALGVPQRAVPDDPAAVTPVCTVKVYPDGNRQMSGRGFQQALPPLPLPDAFFVHKPVLAIDPNLGAAASETALRAAAAGCPVIAMDFQNDPEVVRTAHIVMTSHDWLVREGPLKGLTPEAAAVRLCEMGAPIGIVTQGEKGCVVADATRTVTPIPAYPADPVVDTTGAGDTFRAGLCWGLIQRPHPWSLLSSVRFASAAASLHCQTLGGGSRPPLAQVQHLMQTTVLRDVPSGNGQEYP